LRRNCTVFISNTTGATSGRGTAHSSVVTQRVIIVEEELPTLLSTEVTRLLPLVVKELRSLVAPVVLLMKTVQFLLN
jgi:hypothetical protein